MIRTFSSGRTTDRQRSPWKSARPVEPRDPEAAVQARRERERQQRRTTTQRARPPRGEEERHEHGEREPDEHERRARAARGSRAEGRRRASTAAAAGCGARPRRGASRARTRVAATIVSASTRASGWRRRSQSDEAGERRQHRADVAELLGEVVAAESRGQVVRARAGRSAVTRVGTIRLARSSSKPWPLMPSGIGVRERDPQVRRRDDERDGIRERAQQRGSGTAARARCRA